MDIETDLAFLAANRARWRKTSLAERSALLDQVKERLLPIAADWVSAAAQHKGIAADSPLVGEEWLSGPYVLMAWCNAMQETLRKLAAGRLYADLPLRTLATGQLAVRVLPQFWWERLLLSGVRAEIWLELGVTREDLAQQPALLAAQSSRLALVLGAGNIAAIAPLDALHLLYVENSVAIVKLNPVNDYLAEFLALALSPFIERGFIRLLRGGAEVGETLCQHPLVEAIHITGSSATFDAIVWGTGEAARANKAKGAPRNTRKMSAELGGVSPTLVVPGPWSAADLAFQAEQVATQKLHNCGFNCIACQVLVLPRDWAQKSAFLAALEQVVKRTEPRTLYYPGALQRLEEFAAHYPQARRIARADGSTAVWLANLPDSASAGSVCETGEVFAPWLAVRELAGTDSAAWLEAAIEYANEQLAGTLGANIVIHPTTLQQIGAQRFEELLLKLRYGAIAVNCWSGLAFLTPQASWGAFPGHTLEHVGSGLGVVHNTLLLPRPQRTVIHAPFRPFPRSLLGGFSLLPRPPWFITHRKAASVARLLTAFQHRPSALKLPQIFWQALRG